MIRSLSFWLISRHLSKKISWNSSDQQPDRVDSPDILTVFSKRCPVGCKKTQKNKIMHIDLPTWFPTGRCCWAPSCPVAGPTPGWWVHLRCPEPGREWGSVPPSGCFCSGCLQTGGTGCGGCVEAAVEAAAWTDCGGWRPLEDRKKNLKMLPGFWMKSREIIFSKLDTCKITADLLFYRRSFM